MKEDLSSFLPLSSATLHILLSLAGDDLHGYGIMQEVSRQSQGPYKLGQGTLYGQLHKSLEGRVIDELGHRAREPDPAGRYYRLTQPGPAAHAGGVARHDARAR